MERGRCKASGTFVSKVTLYEVVAIAAKTVATALVAKYHRANFHHCDEAQLARDAIREESRGCNSIYSPKTQ